MLKQPILLAMAAATLNIAAVSADSIPALREIKLRPRLGRENVVMRVGDEIVCPANFSVRRSLAGEWKFKGLDRQGAPFGSVSVSERLILSPETDDKDWATIAVPINWWADDRFSYEPRRKF